MQTEFEMCLAPKFYKNFKGIIRLLIVITAYFKSILKVFFQKIYQSSLTINKKNFQ